MRTAWLILWLLGACANSNGDGDVPSDPNHVCTNTCPYHHDGECDDGATGATTADCAYGTDCADCGPRPLLSTTCTCDTTTACDAGCLCDPECGTETLGTPCTCADGSDVCSNTQCASHECLWYGGTEGYCSQQCGTCPSGFECNDLVGLGSYCIKAPNVANCGACTDSSQCEPFSISAGTVEAACFNGRCRMRCDSNSPCNCITATPTGGNATGYCADDGC